MKNTFLTILIIFISQNVLAHKNHHHQPATPPSESELKANLLGQINEMYKQEVKPILEKKCFDCHSQNPKLPWYYQFPGAKQLIDADIAEAKDHIDFSNDFPFKGHGNTKEDLEAIKDDLEQNSMPPFRYLILHRETKLTPEENRIILNWVQKSQEILKATP